MNAEQIESLDKAAGKMSSGNIRDPQQILLISIIWFERVIVSLGVFFIGMFAVRQSPASAIIGVYLLAISWPALRIGIRATRKNRAGAGLAAVTVSMWTLVLLVSARGTVTLVALVFPVILPLVIAMPYLSRRGMLIFTIGAVLMCLLISTVAAFGPFLPSTLSDSHLAFIMIPIGGATSFLTMMALWHVGTALRESIDTAEATSQALMESEKQLELKVELRTSELLSKNTELENALAETSGVDQIAQVAIATANTESVIDTLATVLHSVFPFNGLAVVLLDEERKDLVIEYTSGTGILDGELVNDSAHNRIPMAEKNSAFTYVVKKNQPFFLGEITEDIVAAMSPSDRWFYETWGPISLLICPLVIQKEVMGVMLFANSEQSIKLSRPDISRIRRYLNPFAAAIQSARLFEEAQTARAVAEEASNAKSLFLASMSHELRTPLTAIIGYSEMIMEEAEDSQEHDPAAWIADVEQIKKHGDHLLGLINGVLDLSKIEAGKQEIEIFEFAVKDLIDDIVESVQPLIKQKGNTLEAGDLNGISTMSTDRSMLRQSLLNLLSNASKFTERGIVSIDVQRVSEAGIDWLHFRVTDTGIGMTSEQCEKIFEVFAQADSSTSGRYGGTGLGLAITKEFCNLLGGDISVKSELGQGTEFTISLPAIYAVA